MSEEMKKESPDMHPPQEDAPLQACVTPPCDENAPEKSEAQAAEVAVDEGAEKEKKSKNGAKKRRISKRLLGVIIGVCAVLVALGTVLVVNLVRDNSPPKLETVRGRFEGLIDASFAVNDAIFGEGLPTYPRVYENVIPFTVTFMEKPHTCYYFTIDDAEYGTVIAYQYYVRRLENEGDKTYTLYDLETGGLLAAGDPATYRFAQKTTEQREGYLYSEGKYYYYALPDYPDPDFIYKDTDDKDYDYVRFDNTCRSTDDIKKMAERVYSAAYLSALYPGLFEGVAYAESGGIMYARYRDYTKDGISYLQKSNVEKGQILPDRRYDYDTMRIASGSNAKYVKIEIESYVVELQGDQEVFSDRCVVTLSFALENGNWFLDSPTY